MDTRYVSLKAVKKMLLKRARLTYWKKWAAKHEYEELEEGIWLEPALALLRRRTEESTNKKTSCCKDAGAGRRMGAEKTFRHWSVKRKHVACHRTEKGKKEMSHIVRYATDENEKADEFAKDGATRDEGFSALARAKTVQQE